MANSQLFSNNASAFLAAPITDTATSISVSSGTGSWFPDLSVGGTDYALLTIQDPSGTYEIVRMTSRAGDVLTVVRGQEATNAQAWSTDARIELRLTNHFLSRLIQLAESTNAMIRPLNMGNFKITNLGMPTEDLDAVPKIITDDLEENMAALESTMQHNTTGAQRASGTADALVATYTPNLDVPLQDNTRILLIADKANTSSTVTLQVNSQGPIPIWVQNWSSLLVGEITAGYYMDLVYKASLNIWVWLNNRISRSGMKPIGSVEMTFTNTNPVTYLEYGTWVQRAQGRFIVGQGAGSAGGENRTYPARNDSVGRYKITLTEDQMPKHGHPTRVSTVIESSFRSRGSGGFPLSVADDSNYGAYTGTPSEAAGKQVGGTGGSQAHENSPPAYGVYVWERTA